MEVWKAADRIERPAAVVLIRRLSDCSATPGDLRRQAWESRFYIVIVLGAVIGLLASAGAMSQLLEGWTQFAGLVHRVIS